MLARSRRISVTGSLSGRDPVSTFNTVRLHRIAPSALAAFVATVRMSFSSVRHATSFFLVFAILTCCFDDVSLKKQNYEMLHKKWHK